MCDTQEHIKIGEKAFSWSLDILKSGRAGTGYTWVNELVARKYAPYPSTSYDRGGRPLVFLLSNGAQVSYGDILGLAGDFYPEYAKIFADRERVQKGHELLLDSDAVADDNPGVPHIEEINRVLHAYHKKLDDPKSWKHQDEVDARPGILQVRIDKVHDWQSHDFGRVLRLALNNPDHFGIEAVEKWERYHRLACEIAAEGRRYYDRADARGYKALSGGGLPANRGQPSDPQIIPLLGSKAYPLVNSLWLALRYNAFGDHFLSDLFSSGHMRTPRWDLMEQFPTGHYRVHLGNFGTTVIGSAELDLASVLSGIHHDEDGRYGLWCDLLLGNLRLGSIGTGCAGIDVGQFFARGDGHYLDPANVDARALCYRAVALSIRDVLFASLIGKDPREATHYWTPFGGKSGGAGARWAALRLVPRPLPPNPDWKYVPHRSRKGPDGKYWNHQPLAMPTDGLEGRWQRLREYVTAPDGATHRRTAEQNELRQKTFKYYRLPYIGTDLGDPHTGPGTSGTYYDLKAWLAKPDGFLENIGSYEWWSIEMGRLAMTYGGYKSLDPEPHDNDGHAE